MDVAQIGYNLDLLAKNIASLQTQVASLPDPDAVKDVVGGETEDEEKNFSLRLRWAAGTLSREVEKVRRFVKMNADALTRAAQSLQQNETDNSLSAGQAVSFIQDTVESVPSTTASPGPAAPPNADPASAAAAARRIN